MRLRNTNERFGDTSAIYSAASREALADELASMLATWAAENTDEAVEDDIQRLRDEFLDGLEEVPHAS